MDALAAKFKNEFPILPDSEKEINEAAVSCAEICRQFAIRQLETLIKSFEIIQSTKFGMDVLRTSIYYQIEMIRNPPLESKQ